MEVEQAETEEVTPEITEAAAAEELSNADQDQINEWMNDKIGTDTEDVEEVEEVGTEPEPVELAETVVADPAETPRVSKAFSKVAKITKMPPTVFCKTANFRNRKKLNLLH